MDAFTWQLIHNYFSESGGNEKASPLVQHQIDSYNEFIDKKITQIIQGFNPIQICHNYKEEVQDFTYKLYLTLNNPCLSKPIFQTQDGSQQLMTPHLARMNTFTYAVNVSADIHILTETINQDNITERNEVQVPNVNIGKIPVMVRSKACVLTQMPGLAEKEGKHECRYDPGGYFIVNGNEKVVISQDRISENKTLVFSNNGCVTEGLTAEIRSVPDGVFLPPKTTSIHLNAKPNHLGRIIRLSTSFLRSEIPVFIMFRALGILSDKDILQHIVYDLKHPKNQRIITELAATMEDASDMYTQEDALKHMLHYTNTSNIPKEYLEHNSKTILLDIIKSDFLPHVGTSFKRKALYLGYMIRKIMYIYLGYQSPDNRDSYLHKRIDSPGILLANLFRQCYGKAIKEMKTAIQRELQLWRATPNIPTNLISQSNIHRFFKPSIIEMGIKYALSTGNWGVKTLGSFQNIRSGVAQVLNRMSYLSTLSHLRRINTPMEKNGKLVQPRKLENSQYGMICLAETPEGSSVGLVKNMALSTKLTIASTSEFIRERITNLGTHIYDDTVQDFRTFLTQMSQPESVYVQINGDIVGYHTDPNTFYQTLKSMKRKGDIPPTTCVAWDIPKNTIVVSTEAGRMCRPLYVVKNNKINTRPIDDHHFYEFIADIHNHQEGFIEYLDTEEIDKSMVAMFPHDLTKPQKGTRIPPHFTHCEIHPSLMMGVLACNIPFSDHNQSPRNCYQCLWEEEPVLMADGSRKKIKDVRVGDEVITFHPETMKTFTTKVINQYVKPTNKQMVEVCTINGRKIVTTDDHKFMTNKGWLAPKHFDHTTRVAILSTPDITSNTLFLPVTVTPTHNRMIADITVESDTHCFFGGDLFAVHNSAMGKQAVGIYMSNFNHRIDTIAHVLNYGQKPLARTKLAKYTNAEHMPSGVNAVVAIMTKTGFNMEDSIMVNRSALDRGLFTSTYYKAYRDQCSKNHSTGEEEQFTRPLETNSTHVKPYNYSKLDQNGFVPPNTFVNDQDVLIGKVMPQKLQGQQHMRDMSMVMKTNDNGHVDMNYQGTNSEGYKFCKVRIRKYRKPTIGDKLSSRHGQKGSIGMIYSQEDMPFTKDGIMPDIIINPHAIPSRMTIGQLIECIMGKAACFLGAQGDATPFNGCGVENIADILQSYGMERYGNEILYNGRTGEMIHTEIFIGPTFYQRLKHMVSDKVHCLLPDHEVFTCNRGWIPINMVKETDLVATLEDGKLKYTQPLECLAFPNYKGKMYHVSNTSVDLDVTINHRMYVASGGTNEYRLEQAEDIIGKYVTYKKDAVWDAPDYNITSYQTCDTQLPEWVWKLSRKQSQELIHHLNPSSDACIYTDSTLLAGQIQQLCVQAGWAGTVHYDTLRVEIIKSDVHPAVNNTYVTKEYTYDYEGPVFCLRVPSEVFMVRRNGKAVWTGNSRGSSGPVVKHRHSGYCKIPASLRYGRQHNQIAGTTWKSIVPRII